MDDALDKFRPLSPEELASAQATAVSKEDNAGEVVLPVPTDAPNAPRLHSRFGAPTVIWTYLDTNGATLSYMLRFDPPSDRKQFVPLSLWRDETGIRWRWKALPSPRPLYGLDSLAARPGAAVIVCEGEKSADAAARIVPGSVAVTSPGGSKAASKTDWNPLAGRKVMIWPDADGPGAKYGREVAGVLADLGCEVSVIGVDELASIDPKGGKREPANGWDAADAETEWLDLTALEKLATALAKAFNPSPAYVSFGHYEMTAQGLIVEIERGRGSNKTKDSIKIAAPFEILGACRDPRGRGWGKWLRLLDGDGREHLRHVEDAALQGDPAALCSVLASEGLWIDRSQQRTFAQYLSGARVKSRVTVVARTGWHDIGGNSVFVLPSETIGPRGAETVILDAAANGPYEVRGTLKQWQDGVGALAGGQALPIFAISAALAGPLLQLAGQEGGGVNFFGPSSTGKTTLLQLAASAWGRGASPGYVRTWRATANGLEGLAASATDTTLILDELSMVDARDAAAAFYGLSNGAGKARAARDGSLREPKSWRLMALSSGEIPIEIKLAEDRGRKARAGQLVRMLDVPADRGRGYGAFDHSGQDNSAGDLAKNFKRVAISAYGTAGPEFVRHLIVVGVTGGDVRSQIADFIAANVPAGADGQIDRAAQRFGLIAVAGELATGLGITPWRNGEAWDAAAWALARWIEGRGGSEAAEVRQAIEQVRLFIEQHGEARFEPHHNEPMSDVNVRPVSNRAGWRKGNGAEREWMIPSETWRKEICAGLDPTFVAKALFGRGMLDKAADGFQPVRKIGGVNKRVYIVKASIFDGSDNAG